LAALPQISAAPAIAQAHDPLQWAGLHYRQVGPWRGGRATTVTGVPSQPDVFYMGTTGGGVWKTTDAGHSWNNTSDGQIGVASMGAVAVADSNPQIVYAGSGSSKIRSNVSIGRGVWKSVDGAKTWQFIGLREIGQISTIRINPANPDEVFVASTGNPFAFSKDRGVYRSRDGGKTWTKILFINETLGAADLEMAADDPKTLYAAMWHGIRRPWTITSGSKDGGLYKSVDGGDTWTKLAAGLPGGLFGRANIGISAAAPGRLYALIEAKPGAGLYRSDDRGQSWALVNGDSKLTTRPFYYTTLGVDPNNADQVFVGNEDWFRSVDGGKNFTVEATPHSDNHDVWINPRNSNLIVQANDGGANVSRDGGRTWTVQSNQPTTEMYQVAVDNQFPYRLYGAQQDNSTVIVPSQPLGNGQAYMEGPGCETGPIIPKIDDPLVVWAGCKGQFSRLDLRTNRNEQQYWIGSESLYGANPKDLRFRFQRVAPMEVSPVEPNTIYYGSQHVHRSTDGGVNWEVISPDLTANPPEGRMASGDPITIDATGEEVYSTVYAIRESAVQPGVIWAGSNDGLVHVTRNGGKTWTNVTPKGLPPGGRVQNIDPGVRAAGTAYVAYHRYLLGDFSPHAYRTDDFGKTWTRITTGFAADEPVRVVREDPVRSGLLYAGTEFGMYISFDRGARWQSFQIDLPATPITDIRLAHGDLILSTQGRGFYILDNIDVLRLLPAPGATVPAPLLHKPVTAVRISPSADYGTDPKEGPEYRPPGAMIDYFLPAGTAAVTLAIVDASGKELRRFSSDSPAAGPVRGYRYRPVWQTKLAATPGMHRLIWDLRRGSERGALVPPGDYTVVMTAGSATARQPLSVVADPRVLASGVTNADLVELYDHNLRVAALAGDTMAAATRLRTALKNNIDPAKLAALNSIAARLLTPPVRYSPPGLESHVNYLRSQTADYDGKVGNHPKERYAQLRAAIDGIVKELEAAIGPAAP
ncbi:VPS10 domain-containing protein, partial [Sandarakinorhabdus sp.]|uniref:VPS10 domain-containing protein n=1 Tax=Sandarakinorhabdus sp. TaxID=1916663 RepID=UPI00286E7B3A